jgi:hypothetical protein
MLIFLRAMSQRNTVSLLATVQLLVVVVVGLFLVVVQNWLFAKVNSIFRVFLLVLVMNDLVSNFGLNVFQILRGFARWQITLTMVVGVALGILLSRVYVVGGSVIVICVSFVILRLLLFLLLDRHLIRLVSIFISPERMASASGFGTRTRRRAVRNCDSSLCVSGLAHLMGILVLSYLLLQSLVFFECHFLVTHLIDFQVFGGLTRLIVHGNAGSGLVPSVPVALNFRLLRRRRIRHGRIGVTWESCSHRGTVGLLSVRVIILFRLFDWRIRNLLVLELFLYGTESFVETIFGVARNIFIYTSLGRVS